MYNRDLTRVRMSYPRTSSEAFKDFTYGACIERPAPRTYGRSVWIVVALCAIALAIKVALS